MTEKEFLIAYCKYVVGNRYKDAERIMNGHNKLVDQFLEEHHKEYYEVEFVKKLKPLEMVDDRNILSMDDGEGEKTIHEMYDGRTVSFTKCWEDNEGFQHHIDGCSYECGIGHPR